MAPATDLLAAEAARWPHAAPRPCPRAARRSEEVVLACADQPTKTSTLVPNELEAHRSQVDRTAMSPFFRLAAVRKPQRLEQAHPARSSTAHAQSP
jgi:hypothetical protein